MKSIPFKLEEVPVVAAMVKDSLNRDLADFTAFSPKYNAAFVSDISTKVKNVEAKTNTQVFIAELKALTNNLYGITESLRSKITRLEGYIMLAKEDLNIAPDDFGIKEVRKKLSSKDVEGLLDKLRITLTHVGKNMAALEAKGFTAAAKAELDGLVDTISGLNLQQNLKMDEKEAGVQANLGLIQELWDIVAEVLDVGKRIYKYDNPEKTGGYTSTTLKSRIRHEASGNEAPVSKGSLSGTVVNKAGGAALAGAKVEVTEKGIVMATDEEGEFYREELDAGSYSISVTKEGFKEVIVKNVVITLDETTELTVEMEAVPVA